jgi:hypothetical protein
VSFGSRYRRFGGMCCHHLQGKTVVHSKDGASMLLRNVVAYPPNYTASHSRRQHQTSTLSNLWVFNCVSFFKYDIHIVGAGIAQSVRRLATGWTTEGSEYESQ